MADGGEKSGAPARSGAWKKIVLATVWAVAALAWAGVAAVWFTSPPKSVWLGVVVTAAVLTEVAFWTSAAVLGLSILQSRRAIWRFLTRPFRRGAA